MAENWQDAGFGIYIHWPFCQSKCPYCDFNSHVRADVDQARWRAALLQELSHEAAALPGRRVETIFFGGGTPSLMAPETVEAVISAIATHWELAPDAEVTLEANPGSVEAGRFAAYAQAGVNRISMGVQSLYDDDLKSLGRLHTGAEARAAFDIARRAFDRVSFDLIYARQDQTEGAWKRELQEAVAMAVDHLSLYQLTLEPGTRFHELAELGKLRGLPDTERAADMYLATRAYCAEIGLPAYEVSNHARAGAECRHNLLYWRCGDYVGIGPGACGFLSHGRERWATETERMPERWLQKVETVGSGIVSRKDVSARDQAENYLMMAMRLGEGVNLKRYRDLGGAVLGMDELISDGILILQEDRLKVADQYFVLLNTILSKILTD